jgi:hypothetical protein
MEKPPAPLPAPPFARDFPHDAELDALVAAFSRGDYGRVRAEGAALARETKDEAIGRAAQELVDRTRPDPLAVALLGLAALLLVILTAWAIAHGKAPPGGANPAVSWAAGAPAPAPRPLRAISRPARSSLEPT